MNTTVWTKQSPQEFGDYWWWDGVTGNNPVALGVNVWSEGRFYCPGQPHPFDDETPLDEFDGWWAPNPAPPLPVEESTLVRELVGTMREMLAALNASDTTGVWTLADSSRVEKLLQQATPP